MKSIKQLHRILIAGMSLFLVAGNASAFPGFGFVKNIFWKKKVKPVGVVAQGRAVVSSLVASAKKKPIVSASKAAGVLGGSYLSYRGIKGLCSYKSAAKKDVKRKDIDVKGKKKTSESENSSTEEDSFSDSESEYSDVEMTDSDFDPTLSQNYKAGHNEPSSSRPCKKKSVVSGVGRFAVNAAGKFYGFAERVVRPVGVVEKFWSISKKVGGLGVRLVKGIAEGIASDVVCKPVFSAVGRAAGLGAMCLAPVVRCAYSHPKSAVAIGIGSGVVGYVYVYPVLKLRVSRYLAARKKVNDEREARELVEYACEVLKKRFEDGEYDKDMHGELRDMVYSYHSANLNENHAKLQDKQIIDLIEDVLVEYKESLWAGSALDVFDSKENEDDEFQRLSVLCSGLINVFGPQEEAFAGDQASLRAELMQILNLVIAHCKSEVA